MDRSIAARLFQISEREITMHEIHIDDVPQIAENAYALFALKNPNAGGACGPTPGWSGLPPRTRQSWLDTVLDYRRTPALINVPSPNLKEAAITQAIKEFPPRPEYNPDGDIAKLQATSFGQRVADAVVAAVKDEGGVDAKRRK